MIYAGLKPSRSFFYVSLLIFATHWITAEAAEEKCSLKKVKLDTIFLIDGSLSIKPDDFKKGLKFVNKFIDFLREQGIDIEDETARIGAIEFSGKGQLTVVASLGQFTSPLVLKNKILHINQSDGDTYTGDGLSKMQDMFNENQRNGSYLQLGVVLTDGTTTKDNRDVMRQKAAELNAANVTMYAIGVGKDTTFRELKRIAGYEVEDEDDDNNNNHIGTIDLNDMLINDLNGDDISGYSGNNNDRDNNHENLTRVFQLDSYDSLESISSSLFTTVCVDITNEWGLFGQPKVFIPLGGVIIIIVVVIVVLVVVWRLSILARRKYILNQLSEAKDELRRSQSDINRLYVNPRTTVNMQELMRSSVEGGGGSDGAV